MVKVANTKVAKVAAATFPKMLREQKSFIQAGSQLVGFPGFHSRSKPGQPRRTKNIQKQQVAVVCTVMAKRFARSVTLHGIWVSKAFE